MYRIQWGEVMYDPHCAKVQKYEQGKIGLQFFDMWH